MSEDWMTPEERALFAPCIEADGTRSTSIYDPVIRKADARIRELEEKLKTARKDALEEAASVAELLPHLCYSDHNGCGEYGIEVRIAQRIRALA